MKLKDFLQEAKETLSLPPENSYNKNEWAEMIGTESASIGDVHKYLRQKVKDGKMECCGSYKVNEIWNRYYRYIE